MPSVMVVDDDVPITRLVQQALEEGGHQVLVAHDGSEALRVLATNPRLDVVVLDVMMADVDGIQVCQSMRGNPLLATIPILFLTERGTLEDRIAGYEAGCDDYLSKPFDLRELELRVEALVRYRERTHSDHRLVAGGLEVDPDTGRAWQDGRTIDLTPIEFELLHYFILHMGQVVSSERLLRDVWGYALGDGNTSLVRMHMLNLRRKIEADPQNPQLLRTVHRHGYVLQPK